MIIRVPVAQTLPLPLEDQRQMDQPSKLISSNAAKSTVLMRELHDLHQ